MRSRILFIFLLSWAFGASAATYYVAPTGNNSNAGTSSESPWKTIGHATGIAEAGDTVNIEAGTYNENLNFARSGSTGKPITFNGAGIGQTIIQGSGLPNFYVTFGANYVTLQNVSVYGTTSFSAGYGGLNSGVPSGIGFNGSHCLCRGVEFTHFGDGSVRFASVASTAVVFSDDQSNNTFTSGSIHHLGDVDSFHIFGTNQTVSYNHIYNVNTLYYGQSTKGTGNHTDFVQTWGFSGQSSNNIFVIGNLVENDNCDVGDLETGLVSGRPNTAMYGWYFANNVFYNVGSCLFAGVARTYFYNNLFYHVGADQGYAVSLYDGDPDDSGPPEWYNSAGTTFINNCFTGNTKDINLHGATAGKLGTVSNNYFDAPTDVSGTHSVSGGSLNFVRARGLNFRVSPGSVLIGRGMTISSFNTDADQNARPASGWDIGPYQFGRASPTRTPGPRTRHRDRSNPSATQ